MNQKLFISLMLVLLVGTGCTRKSIEQIEGQQVHRAPATEEETGYLVTGATESEIVDIVSKTSAQFRVVNKNHGMYELTNITRPEILKNHSHLQVTKNHFVEMYSQSSKAMSLGKMKALAAEVNAGHIKQCVENENPPVLEYVVSINGAAIDKNFKYYVQPGDAVKIDITDSKSLDESSLKYGFLISVSPVDTQAVMGTPILEFDVVEAGGVTIAPVVQDGRGTCASTGILFLATLNDQYLGAGNALESSDLSAEEQDYLKMISVPQAWEISTGHDVVIAIIDTGVNYNHPDLIDNILTNSNEVPDNGVDDDGNGFVDDYVGYDFEQNDGLPFDDVGHGSHVAGIAAASTFGVAPNAKILPIKALGPYGGDLASIAGAIRYAGDMGAQVVNMSFGNYGTPSQDIIDAIDYLESTGAVIVAAAGNGDPTFGIGMNTDNVPNYPSAFENEAIIAVSACDGNGDLTPYSNYGEISVDVLAPGGLLPDAPIVSATMKNTDGELYRGEMGTSMAAPVIAGVAALMLDADPMLKPVNLKKIMMEAGEKKADLQGIIGSGRVIDVHTAVKRAKGN